MSNIFSHYQSKMLKAFKEAKKSFNKGLIVKLNSGQTCESIEQWTDNIYYNIHKQFGITNGKNINNMTYVFNTFIAECITKNEVYNYYIETKELNDYFKTKPNYDDEIIIESVKQYGVKKICNHYISMTPVILHIRGANKSIGFIMHNINGEFAYYITDGEKHIGGMSSLIKNHSGENVDMLYLVINFLLYKTCFPEKITSTPPKCFIEYNGGTKNCYLVSESKEIIYREGKRAHFRSGHYRLLSSDRFKNKKGQVVYVRSSFVGKEIQNTVSE